jgi:hypothetical protein
MTDDKTQPNPRDLPEQAKPRQVDRQQPQQSQSDMEAPPAPRAAPGRPPLFGK